MVKQDRLSYSGFSTDFCPHWFRMILILKEKYLHMHVYQELRTKNYPKAHLPQEMSRLL